MFNGAYYWKVASVLRTVLNTITSGEPITVTFNAVQLRINDAQLWVSLTQNVIINTQE